MDDGNAIDISDIDRDFIEDKNDFDLLCNKNNGIYKYFPSIMPPVKRIIVIGDLHGDLNMTIKSLKIAKIVDNNMNWIGGKTVVVQIGDQVDRCRPLKYECRHPNATINDEASDIKILKLFNELNNKAIKDGGMVISLLGNHELMNVMGNMNYVSYKGLKQFSNYVDPENPNIKFASGEEARKYAFRPGNEYGKMLGCTRLSSVIIGSNLFVHAGIIPEFVNVAEITEKKDILKINKAVREWLVRKINVDNINNIVKSTKESMFWTRILGSIPPGMNNNHPTCQQHLEPVLKLFNVGHMIVGHTPQFYENKMGINSTCDKKLWRVDNGVSGAFDKFDHIMHESEGDERMKTRIVQVLEILNDNEFNIIM